MNISVGQNSHYGVAIDTFAREVETRTNGRYKVQTFYSGALGAERESIEGVQLGTLDLTLTSTGPLPNFVPEIAILDIPFLFRDYDYSRLVILYFWVLSIASVLGEEKAALAAADALAGHVAERRLGDVGRLMLVPGALIVLAIVIVLVGAMGAIGAIGACCIRA